MAAATGPDASAFGARARATGELSTALGAQSAASDNRTTAAGFAANASAEEATAVGFAARAQAANTLAAGAWSQASGAGAVAIGSAATAVSTGSTAVGTVAHALEIDSSAIGRGATAAHWNSVALGAGSVTTVGYRAAYVGYGLSAPQSSVGEVNVGNRTIGGVAAGIADNEAVNVAQLKAIVETAAAEARNNLQYDRNADGSANRNSVTLASEDGSAAVHNVAAGVRPTDAVNVGQLNDAIERVIGGTTSISDTAFSINATSGTDRAVASAKRAVAAGADASATGEGSVAIGSRARASASNAVAIGQDALADRADSVSIGAAGRERQLTNVASATQGTDAVNLTQLQQGFTESARQANAYADAKADGVRRDSFAGAAAALAVAGLPQAVLPGRGMVAVGGGTYGGQSAVAIGISQLSGNGNWAYKVTGTSTTRRELGLSIGAGRHW